MNVKEVLTRLEAIINTNEPLVILVTKEYPAHFFSFLRGWYKRKKPLLNLTLIDGATVSITALREQVETSFLGMHRYFWLYNLPTTTTAENARLIEYLFQYKGPHTLIVVLSETVHIQESNYIELPPAIAVHQLSQLAPYCAVPSQSVEQLIQHIAGFSQQLSWDSALLLLQYSMVLGNTTDLFCAEWAPRILELPVSLFLLSQYFFAKKANLFFSCWKRVMHEYSEAFWTVYWSEQLFRAGMYLSLKSHNKEGAAKQIAYRLPFSFINYDWRNYSVIECKNAHQFLYDYDYRLKTTNSTAGFELFYAKFFTNQFSEKSKV